MKKLLLIVAVLICFGGCMKWLPPHYLSNEKIISECKKCKDAGMKAKVITGGWQGRAIRVDCY